MAEAATDKERLVIRAIAATDRTLAQDYVRQALAALDARIERDGAMIEALEGEIQALEDGTGLTNTKEQFEAQLAACQERIAELEGALREARGRLLSLALSPHDGVVNEAVVQIDAALDTAPTGAKGEING